MMLSAVDHGTQGGEQCQTGDAQVVGPLAPIAGLVDQGLADIEKDCFECHGYVGAGGNEADMVVDSAPAVERMQAVHD
jgi:hypothetical protein